MKCLYCGEAVRRLHPNLALQAEAAIIQTMDGKGMLHVIARTDPRGERHEASIATKDKHLEQHAHSA